MEIKVAGITFAVKATPELGLMRPSGSAELKHEPFVHPSKVEFNDPLAIRIYVGGVALGYVPAAGEERAAIWNYHAENGRFPEASVKDYSYSTNGKDFNKEYKGVLSSVLLEVSIDGHFGAYVKGGAEYDRASNVIESFDASGSRSPDGHLTKWMIDTFPTFMDYRAHMNNSASSGTAAHDAIRKACAMGVVGMKKNEIECVVSQMDSELFQKIPQGFWNFLSEHCAGCTAVGSEKVVYDEQNQIAGTYDMLMRNSKGDGILIDWKSAKSVTDDHLIKTAFYAYLAGAEEAWVVAFGSANKCGYQLKKLSYAGIVAGHAIMANIAAARKLVPEMKACVIK